MHAVAMEFAVERTAALHNETFLRSVARRFQLKTLARAQRRLICSFINVTLECTVELIVSIHTNSKWQLLPEQAPPSAKTPVSASIVLTRPALFHAETANLTVIDGESEVASW
jgi:hypothetical protein